MMTNLNYVQINSLDSGGMFNILKTFHEQVNEAIDIGKNAVGYSNTLTSNRFAVLGMGGSAIGGDLLASYLGNTIGTEFLSINTSRNYTLPGYVAQDTNIIASSYSGGTEETITAFKEALSKCKNLICITTGGKIGEIAKENSVPVIKIPSGLQPRCALGYSFFPMLSIIMKSGLVDNSLTTIEKDIEETQELLAKKSKEYSSLDENNLALNIAQKILGTIPVIYSGVNGMESVNTRWLRQIQENAKHLAFGGLLPEMNHNEINGFGNPAGRAKEMSVVFIRDIGDHSQTQRRFSALGNLISEDVKQVIEVRSEADSLLARMFDMLYLGDWVSFYLAILNDVDPTPIPLITKLKKILE